MRVARSTGGTASLLPDGLTLATAPNDLVLAIEHANRVCDWQENLQRNEMPPAWMWPFDEEIAAWFEGVQEEREARFGGGGSSNADESVPMMSNEAASGRGKYA